MNFFFLRIFTIFTIHKIKKKIVKENRENSFLRIEALQVNFHLFSILTREKHFISVFTIYFGCYGKRFTNNDLLQYIQYLHDVHKNLNAKVKFPSKSTELHTISTRFMTK